MQSKKKKNNERIGEKENRELVKTEEQDGEKMYVRLPERIKNARLVCDTFSA